MRHNQLNEHLGVLDMEQESYDRSQIFAWVYFPTWIVMSIFQTVCFYLANGKFHPLAAILKGFVKGDQSTIFRLHAAWYSLSFNERLLNLFSIQF